MKVFLSQPMNGLTDEEIILKRNDISSRLHELLDTEEDIEILDSFFTDYNGNGVQFLGKSILLMGEADIVVFMDGWEKVRGCRLEELIAKEYFMARVYE